MFRVWMASVYQLNIEFLATEFSLAIWHACLALNHVYKVKARKVLNTIVIYNFNCQIQIVKYNC